MSDYKVFKITRLDPLSPTFCAAKWLSADFYIHTGRTSSCHLPTPDKIDLALAQSNIHYFNNTTEKLQQKAEMLAGNKPGKCSNCWQVEAVADAISERIIYSSKFAKYDFSKLDASIEQAPITISVSFDTLCNFACSYCDASQSTKWATDLVTNGPYKKIYNDPRMTYQRLGKKELVNDYEQMFELFLQYIDRIKPSLHIINCLGGEPLISPNFWRFIEHLAQSDCSHIGLSVVTNLSDLENIKRLLAYQDKFRKISVTASIESTDARAEFLRAGLNWNTFEANLQWLQTQSIEINLAATCSMLAVDGLVDFLEWYTTLNSIGLNIFRLRHPNFQAMQVLPIEIRLEYIRNVLAWLEKNYYKIDAETLEQIRNICYILSNEHETYDEVSVELLQADAKHFYKQYAERNKFKIQDIFSKNLSDWLLN